MGRTMQGMGCATLRACDGIVAPSCADRDEDDMTAMRADRSPRPHLTGARGTVAIGGLLQEARERDPVGHRLHVIFAMGYLATLPLANSVSDITFAIVVVCALVRLRSTWRCYVPLVRDRVLWLFLATAVMLGLSILWSDDGPEHATVVQEGLTELKAFRVILLPWALWPIVEAAPLLIAGFLVGVFGLDLVQFAQRLGLFGLELKGADRARGLIHPIQSGAFNLAALTWYLAALLSVKWAGDRKSIVLIAALVCGALAAVAGLLFSGSRGVWVAAMLILPVAWVVLAVRGDRLRRAIILLVPAGLALALVLALGGWRYAVDRFEDAQRDYRDAERGDYTGSIGQRILMARWSWRFFAQSPLYGNGAGSFREMSKETPEFAEMESRWPGRAENDKFTPAHPHNAYLHMLTSTGVIGTSLFLSMLVLLMLRAWREPGSHLFCGGAVFVLLGWMIGTLSDCYTLNGLHFGLFALIVALTIPRKMSGADDSPATGEVA